MRMFERLCTLACKQIVEKPVVEKHFMDRIVEKEVEKLVTKDRDVEKIVEVCLPLLAPLSSALGSFHAIPLLAPYPNLASASPVQFAASV